MNSFFFRLIIYSDPTVHGQYTDVVFISVDADSEHEGRRNLINHYNSNNFWVRAIELVGASA
jgi:hypothetical protein